MKPSFMAEVFVANVVPYNLHGSINIVLPKACMALMLSGFLANNYGRIDKKE